MRRQVLAATLDAKMLEFFFLVRPFRDIIFGVVRCSHPEEKFYARTSCSPLQLVGRDMHGRVYVGRHYPDLDIA